MKSFTQTFIAVLGGIVFSVAVAWIASPIGIVTGGVSGLGIVIKEISGGRIPIFATSFILNVPLFIICTLQRGIKFIAKSLIAFLTLTITLSFLENIPTPFDFEGDILMSTLFYGILSGTGLGLVLRAGATSGGTDMLAAIIKKKKPSLPISSLIAIIDALVVLCGVFVFGLRMSLYAIAALFISARVMDIVLSGVGSKKSAFIVSEKNTEIAQRISTELGRGVTGIEAVGMYTGERKRLLFVAVSSRELGELRKIVAESDSKAFVTVSDVRAVLGEGFDEIFSPNGELK